MHPAESARVRQPFQADLRRSELLAECPGQVRQESLTYRRGFTLVEMLIAVAITLVMMAAVVTVFANISDSVQKRRATVEMSNSIRHVRNVLQQDLAGATCPTIPWQRPESNHGYLEIIEGPASDFSPSTLIDRDLTNGQLDFETSAVPGSNLLQTKITAGSLLSDSVTDGAALGDFDDILMLTVRNEKEPFVGRVPGNAVNGNGEQLGFQQWGDETLRSPLAEVIWFSVENPADDQDPTEYFGEPGFRTIYRRTLLIAPSLDLGIVIRANNVDVRMGPGVMRVIPRVGRDRLDLALACLVAFQERYDLSVRLEWDPLIPAWKIVANTLADLTKRENRYEHHGYGFRQNDPPRPAWFSRYPFAVASSGLYYNSDSLAFRVDPELQQPSDRARGNAILRAPTQSVDRYVLTQGSEGRGYVIRPFVYIDDENDSPNAPKHPAPVRALVNAEGQVVYLTAGLVPLGGNRRGEDVMLSDALAFDVRVYDPGAPLLGLGPNPSASNQNISDVVVEPGDAGWSTFLQLSANQPNDVAVYGYGAYVDLGYLGLHNAWKSPPSAVNMPALSVAPQFSIAPRTRSKLNLLGQLPPYYYEPYRVYDTWSFHYENNGLDEDGDGLIDEATNGFDNPGEYILDPSANPPTTVIDTRHGVDDPGERETAPPYDVPLRGMQVRLRAYERDSRQVREVGVKQHFVPE
ncbi:MAG: type II secretion system protein [Pirellulales bacterium]